MSSPSEFELQCHAQILGRGDCLQDLTVEGVVDFLRAGLLAPGDWQSVVFVQVEGHLPFFFPLLQLVEVL